MRWVIWILLILSAAVGTALLMRFNHGNVAVFWPPYRVDLSVNFAVVLLGASFIVLHLVLVGISKAIDLPLRVREYRLRRQRDGAIAALRDGLLAFFEGRFGRAERLAQQARVASDLAGPAALIGARAAHRMREFERRDRWLQTGQDDLDARHATLMTSAELAIEDRQPEQALAMIEQFHARGARHIHSLRLALRAHEQAEDWVRVLQVVRQLEKRDALHPAAVRGLKLRALRGLFEIRRNDLTALKDLWSQLPAAERAWPEVSEAAAMAMAGAGDESTAWLLIDQGMRERLSSGLLRQCLALRTIAARQRLASAEEWRQRHGDEPLLMLTLGRLCIEASLWGKAEEFLRGALKGPDAAAAHWALADLYERTDRVQEAARHYRECARAAFASPAGA